jgi:hypothetical protein
MRLPELDNEADRGECAKRINAQLEGPYRAAQVLFNRAVWRAFVYGCAVGFSVGVLLVVTFVIVGGGL